MTDAKRLTGWHVLAALVAFFGVIIVANTFFVTAAVRSFPGESQKKSYLQGLEYNEVLEERAAQKARGWRAGIVDVSREETRGAISIELADASERALENLTVTGAIQRPAHGREDVALEFVHQGEGVYAASVDGFSAGAWDLSANAVSPAGETFDLHARILVE